MRFWCWPWYGRRLLLCGGLWLASLGLLSATLLAAPFVAPSPPPGSDIPAGLGLTPDGRSDQAQMSAPTGSAREAERLFWDKTPLPITLVVGQERLVTFPGTVRLGIPTSLLADLRTQTQQGTVYWRAQKPFAPTRVQVQDLQSGQYYLIDLAAIEVNPAAVSAFNHPLTVVNAASEQPVSEAQEKGAPIATGSLDLQKEIENGIAEARDGIQNSRHTGATRSTSESADYVILTRYAAQQLYAPTRLLNTAHPLQSAPFAASPTDTLIRGGELLAEPVAAWRKNRLYVTALTLTNRSAQPIDLDPRNLRGQWRTATFQHGRVGPSWSDTAVTALYLISDRPFTEMIDVRE